MSAVYRTRVSRQLAAQWDPERLPDELRIISIEEPPNPEDPWMIVTFEDSEAPDELTGLLVTPVFSTDGRKVILAGREVQQ